MEDKNKVIKEYNRKDPFVNFTFFFNLQGLCQKGKPFEANQNLLYQVTLLDDEINDLILVVRRIRKPEKWFLVVPAKDLYNYL